MRLPFLLICVCLGFLPSSFAQTCSGGLGDPVLNQTFGTRGYQLPPGKTSYPVTGGCPNSSGTYTIASFLFGCGPNSWVQMVGDHTPGDNEGNYMLVNTASTPGTVYTDTVRNLCTNTFYQAGFWYTAVLTKYACAGTPVLPDIQFEVKTLSGTILAQSSTGDLPLVTEKEWKFLGVSVQTSATVTDLVIRIYVNSPWGCGSAFAIDDVTLRPCSPSVVTADVNGGPGPVNVCSDYTGTWSATAGYTPGFMNPVFQWQTSADSGKTWKDIPGETALTYTIPMHGLGKVLYRLCIAENGNINSVSCRITSNVLETGVYPVPPKSPPLDLVGCLGNDFTFPDPDQGVANVLWSGPNGFSSTSIRGVLPSVQYADAGLYTILKTYPYGCSIRDTFNLQVFPSTAVSTPLNYNLCEGQPQQLQASASGNVSYQWSPPDDLSATNIPNPVASPKRNAGYKVIVTNEYGCRDSAYVSLWVYKKPVADAGPDQSINLGDSVMLSGQVSGDSVSYSWSPTVYMSNPGRVNPVVYPPLTQTYTLTVQSGKGCGTAVASAKVIVYTDVFIPSAFTPDDNGLNDRFKIFTAGNNKMFHLLIYNRWGQPVFESRDPATGWDGKWKGALQPPGVYVYLLQLKTARGKEITRQGSVVLVR